MSINETYPMNLTFTDEQVKGLSIIPISMSGLNIRVINALEKHEKNSLYSAIVEIKSGLNSIKGIGTKSIEESKVVVEQIISRLKSFPPEEESDLDYRLALFDGLFPDKEVRKALESLPISMIGLSNRAINTIEKKHISNIYEAVIEIKTGFQTTEGIGKKTINESIQIIDAMLLKLKGVAPHLIDSVIDPRTLYFKEAEGNFLAILNEIVDIYFEKQVKQNKKRNKNVLIKRFNLDGSGIYRLEEIGTYYDVSRERIRQIEEKTLKEIELLLTGQLKTKEWYLDKKIINNYNQLKHILYSKDFIILHSELLDIIDGQSQNQFNDLYLPLLMELLGFFRLAKTYTNFRGTIYDSWCRTDHFNPPDIESLFVALNVVFENPEPISLFDLIVKVKKKSRKKFTNDVIHLALKVCPEIEINDDELYVKPEFTKSTTDKAYKILAINNDKMHYSEILREINSLGNNKTYTRLNLTNQLAADDRFISIGKSGYWGLKKWGTINNISIVKVMENLLHRISKPVSYHQILQETQKIRPDAKEKSIKIYLDTKPDIFARVDKDHYALTVWNLVSYQGQRSQARLTNSEFYEKTLQVLQNKNPINFSDFIRQMMKLTNSKNSTIRQRVLKSPLLTARFINSREKEIYCDNLDKLKNYKDKDSTLRYEIQNRIVDLLKGEDKPITKGDLYKKLSKNFTCVKQTFYRYLSEMNGIRQFIENNNSYVEVIDKKQRNEKYITVDEFKKLRNDIFKLSSDLTDLKVSSESKNEQIDEIYKLLDKESENADISKYQNNVIIEFPKYNLLENNSLKFLESSYYLYDKLKEVQGDDYSPYVLQFSRVIENELLHKFFIPFNRKFNLYEDKNEILEKEMNNFNTKIFAKFLYKNNEKYTLGSMQTIIGFIYKSNGNTLQKSTLLQVFRKYVITLINPDFLSKDNVDLLSTLTSKYRNKAAHTEIITFEDANEFSSVTKSLITLLLNSYKL
ncbi:MAG: hypothetical protein HQL46_04445 [Gammaproteobacteria bacterium]|nr:hypothetical protein [Gammaproteobacteria bacterium]